MKKEPTKKGKRDQKKKKTTKNLQKQAHKKNIT